jgi:NAD(P)-dependent dehydrogenase (short-subunit alcohol dehydrogenase family)
MPTTLITGASRGIGLELTRQYAADGWRVLATCRDPAQAGALNAIAGTVEIHPLDVTDFEAVDRLAQALAGTAIDLLINNAGILGPTTPQLEARDYMLWYEVFATNAMAPFKISTAFARHVARSEKKCIVAISSRQGSIGLIESPERVVYRSSKAGLNAIVKSLSLLYRDQGITVVALSPGWVRTDMAGPQAALAVADSVAGLRRVIAGLDLSQSGRFFGYQGDEIGW